jgi:hypothetical protein
MKTNCWNCGKEVLLDSHLTEEDIARRDIDIEDNPFCDEECFKNWLKSSYPTWADACLAGYDEEFAKFFPDEVED